jgi:hypothetical protein
MSIVLTLHLQAGGRVKDGDGPGCGGNGLTAHIGCDRLDCASLPRTAAVSEVHLRTAAAQAAWL